MLSNNSRLPVFFDHLAKNAGMSIRRILSWRYTAAMTFAGNGLRTDALFSEGNRYPLVTGHITHRTGFDPSLYRYCATVLRHPVDRTLSAYHYFKNDSVFLYSRGLQKLPPLAELLEDPFLSGEIGRDFQCLHFARIYKEPIDEFLTSAKAALESYHLVGIQERLELFVRKLHWDLGFGNSGDVPHENATNPYPRKSELDKSLIRAIEAQNQHDMALWEWARERAEKWGESAPLRVFFFKELGAATVSAANEADASLNDASVQIIGTRLSAGHRRFNIFAVGETIELRVVIYSAISRELVCDMGIENADGIVVFATDSEALDSAKLAGAGECLEISFEFCCNLSPGIYSIRLRVREKGKPLGNCLATRFAAGVLDVRNFFLPAFRGLVYLPATAQTSRWVSGPESGLMLPLNLSQISLVLSLAQPSTEPLRFKAGSVAQFVVKLENNGIVWLYSRPPVPVNFAYHILAADKGIVVFDGERTSLIAPIGPVQDLQQNVLVLVPAEPGEYIIRLTLVQEGRFWFDTLTPPVFIDVPVIAVKQPCLSEEIGIVE